MVVTEEQFVFVLHLIGPFFQRFHLERTQLLLAVSQTQLQYCAILMKLYGVSDLFMRIALYVNVYIGAIAHRH